MKSIIKLLSDIRQYKAESKLAHVGHFHLLLVCAAWVDGVSRAGGVTPKTEVNWTLSSLHWSLFKSHFYFYKMTATMLTRGRVPSPGAATTESSFLVLCVGMRSNAKIILTNARGY